MMFLKESFVLINGSSFSASSILTSKLKNDKKAVLVGEETGGANDGTVAGFYSFQTLLIPRSICLSVFFWYSPILRLLILKRVLFRM
jgi:C-terminal processing protease CtpA/Prc